MPIPASYDNIINIIWIILYVDAHLILDFSQLQKIYHYNYIKWYPSRPLIEVMECSRSNGVLKVKTKHVVHSSLI